MGLAYNSSVPISFSSNLIPIIVCYPVDAMDYYPDHLFFPLWGRGKSCDDHKVNELCLLKRLVGGKHENSTIFVGFSDGKFFSQ